MASEALAASMRWLAAFTLVALFVASGCLEAFAPPGDPDDVTLAIASTRVSLAQGETVVAHTTLANRGLGRFHYNEDCVTGGPWSVHISNASGELQPAEGKACAAVVRERWLGPRTTMVADFTWDGSVWKGDHTERASPGRYAMRVVVRLVAGERQGFERVEEMPVSVLER